MARRSSFLLFLVMVSFNVASISHGQLSPSEQEAAYLVLSAISPTVPWRTLYPDDLCAGISPHGVVCDLFLHSTYSAVYVPHITEFNFGYVSEYNPNPRCSHNSSFSPHLFTSFKFLRRLFFYKCFTSIHSPVYFTNASAHLPKTIQEIVFIENPGLTGTVGDVLGYLPSLRRLVLSGTGIVGEIPDSVGEELINAEEITLSRNKLIGRIPFGLSKLRKLILLDLSSNKLDGEVPESLGNLSNLVKLDLSHNRLSGKIPGGLGRLRILEFLDLSFNRFGNQGIPLFLGRMARLKEMYLSGNALGGKIPEIWCDLKDLSVIGLSSLGLTGTIPVSMAVHLSNLSYLGLDNNNLQGGVPIEFQHLKFVGEINLEFNNLTGLVTFSSSFTAAKLKTRGNTGLRLEEWPAKCQDRASIQDRLCSKRKAAMEPVAPKYRYGQGPLLSSSGYCHGRWAFWTFILGVATVMIC